jgi:hypothetical protein
VSATPLFRDFTKDFTVPAIRMVEFTRNFNVPAIRTVDFTRNFTVATQLPPVHLLIAWFWYNGWFGNPNRIRFQGTSDLVGRNVYRANKRIINFQNRIYETRNAVRDRIVAAIQAQTTLEVNPSFNIDTSNTMTWNNVTSSLTNTNRDRITHLVLVDGIGNGMTISGVSHVLIE